MRVESISMDPNKLIEYEKKDLRKTPLPKMIENNSKLSTEKFGKEEQAKIWEDLIGDDIKWGDMTDWQKAKRVALNTVKICLVFSFLYFFVCSLDLLSSSFRLISGKSTGSVMSNEYISSPVVGLMIGILVTVLVQSSSTSTSIIVSMVASGIISVQDAIPMIMGSNIGTSVTNTIVSLTQVGDREQFRRAFSGATVHDMFNWLSVIVLLSVEILTGMLYKLTLAIVNSFSSGNGVEIKLLDVVTEPFTDLIIQLDSQIMECWALSFMMDEDSMIRKYCKYVDTNVTEAPILSSVTAFPNVSTTAVPLECQETEIGEPHSCHFIFYETSMSDATIGIILLVISLTILCSSLICIVKLLNSMLKGSIATVIHKVINADIPYVPWLTGYIAIAIGAVLTFIVQSSSVFTSTLTPLIGIGMISVERAYPLTLGSNLGTTTTALLAAMAAVGDKTDSIQIALVHTFFNVFGILLFYPIPLMRMPIPLCKGLGNITANYRWFAIFYLITMFFVFPGAVFALSMGGTAVLWGVLGPILAILVIVIIVNILQKKAPRILPKCLNNWNFLPEPLHSLDPYDRVFTALPCCKKCRISPESNENDVNEVIVVPSREPLTGIDNPVPVTDELRNEVF